MPDVQPTNNPVPSDHPADARDNFKRIDEFVNLQSPQTSPTRTGKTLDTLFGITERANDQVDRVGFEVPVAYTSGLVMSRTSQTVVFMNDVYHAINVPFTTSGTFETNNFELLRAVTSSDLTHSQEQIIGGDASIFPEFTSSNISNGSVIPLGTTHVRASGNLFSITPLASGVVSLLTSSGCTIGTTPVSFSSAGSHTSVLSLRSTSERSLADRFSDAVNVKDFGAVGDGVADDAAAIQAAVDSGSSIVGNFGETYRVSSQVNITTETYIDFRGATISSDWVASADGNHSTLVFNVDGSTAFTLVNCVINGNRPNSGFGTAIDETNTSPILRFNDSSNIHISRVRIERYGSDVVAGGWTQSLQFGWAAIKVFDCSDVVLRDVTLTDSIAEGIYFYETDDILIDGIAVKDNSTSLITPLHAWYCEGVTIVNSKITLQDTEVSGSVMNVYSRNVRVIGNEIRGGNGLDIGNEIGVDWEAFNIIISNNNFVNCFIRSDLEGNVVINDLKITGNTIRVGSGRPSGIFLAGLINRSEISSNLIFTAGASNCISIRLSAHSDSEGLQPEVTSDTCNIFGNTLFGDGAGSSNFGIDFSRQVRAVNVNVFNNTIKQCDGGINLGSLAAKASYVDWRIYDNTVIIPSGANFNSQTGLGICIYLDAHDSDTTLEAILVDGIEISNNYLESEYDVIRINLVSIVAGKTVTRLRNFAIKGNTVRQTDSSDNNRSGIIVIGSTVANGHIQDLRIIGNNIDPESRGESGALIGLCTDIIFSENFIGSSLFGLTLSSENDGYLIIEDNKPTIPVSFRETSTYIDSSTKKNIRNNGAVTRGLGFVFTDRGTTAQRPDAITDIYEGFKFFDETLNIPIYWDGTQWLNAIGSAV